MNRQRLIDLLAMSRFANLPTVWSNALLGVLVGYYSFRESAHLSPLALTAIGFALSFLYLGGCFFNDWHDLDFDQKTRPDRPIPAGRWSRKTILVFAITLIVVGVSLAAAVSLPAGLFALGIVICILAYTRWHKVHPASFFFMAGARALIYPTAAFSLLSWPELMAQGHLIVAILVMIGLGLGGYILGISLTARAESSKNPGEQTEKNFPILCLCAPAFLISGPLLLTNNGQTIPPLATFIIVLAIIVRRLRTTQDISAFVSRSLAAIPLVDFLFVFVLAEVLAVQASCPLLALTALGLQKIAPAT